MNMVSIDRGFKREVFRKGHPCAIITKVKSHRITLTSINVHNLINIVFKSNMKHQPSNDLHCLPYKCKGMLKGQSSIKDHHWNKLSSSRGRNDYLQISMFLFFVISGEDD